MAVDNRLQAQALLLAFLLGCGAGLFYDLLRPLRWRRGRRLAGFALDLLFCLAVGLGFFILAMACGGGRVEPASLAVAATGFLLYLAWFSPLLLPWFMRAYRLAGRLMGKTRRAIKKFCNFVKKFFQKCRACIIVRR